MSFSEENRPSVANVYPKDGGKLSGKLSTHVDNSANVAEEDVPTPLPGERSKEG